MERASGLSEAEVQTLLAKYGYNEIPAAQRQPLWRLALVIIKEPMILLLLTGAVIYFALGGLYDSLLLLASVLGIVTIAIYQERRSTRALEELRDLSSPRALVRRDGRDQRIAARLVVPGDLLLIKEGDRVAADCRLLETRNLQVDESLLTGESHAVSKRVLLSHETMTFPSPGALYSSTLVVGGSGLAQVVETGVRTEVGKIGKSLVSAPEEKTRLQQEVSVLVRQFGLLGIIFSIVVVLAYGFTREEWPQAILAGIAAAMSLLPEEFPVVLTIFLALGAWRLSKKQVLVRQPAATENLGAVTVLCVDKTGTLTMNEMSVQELRCTEGVYDFHRSLSEAPPASFNPLIEYATLASHEHPFDPMEKALFRVLNTIPSEQRGFARGSLEKEYSLQPGLMAMSCVWRDSAGNRKVVAAKGAPEAIFELCRFDKAQKDGLVHQLNEMTQQGLRVIAVAKAKSMPQELPSSQRDFDFQFIGLIGLVDPMRPNVREAISECYSAGIRVIMITGDNPGTACKIGSDIGLHESQNYLTGQDVEGMSELELRQKIKSINVFARMVPAQKLRIVNALRESGEVVGMTGDGVNDAPSLKWADVGIAMGGRGTDVAREAADLVILDDDFSSLVAGVRLGRRIYQNIQRAMSYIFAVHVPIAALAISPTLLGLPLVLYPAHIVFLELIIDPSCTLIFEAEPEGSNTMKRPPRSLRQPMFGFRNILASCLNGVFVSVALFILFVFCLNVGFSEERSRTVVFVAFVLSNIGMIAINSSLKTLLSNRYFSLVSALAITSLAIVIATPTLRKVFGLAPVSFLDVGLSLTTAFVAWLLNLMFKNKLSLK